MRRAVVAALASAIACAFGGTPAAVAAQGGQGAASGSRGATPAMNIPVVGSPLPAWTRGVLDIHQLSIGRGNSALVVMPDGTTMLVDAGEANDGIPQTSIHPDSSRMPGEWIVRYLRRHLPDSARGLDYAMLTHFHPDHVGAVKVRSPVSASGAYRLSGITTVGDAMRIGTMIDRGWPDYAYVPLSDPDSSMVNYRRFLAMRQSAGMRVERFRAGVRDQIVPRLDGAAFANFEVRNVIGNGVLWTGTDAATTRELFPPLATLAKADWPNENMCSLGIRIRYGAFRWFTGGDLPGTPDPGFPEWHGVEAAVAGVVGPVAVHVVNQHGSMGQESEPFLRTLASRVLIIPSWSPSHPAPDVLKRIVNSRFAPADRMIFATDMREATRIVIGARAGSLAAPPGHVVIRVEPGGARYWVMVLSNADERAQVIAVRGPFAS